MKKFEFEKPFASFFINGKMVLKEKWRISLHDPAYLILFGGALLCLIVHFFIFLFY